MVTSERTKQDFARDRRVMLGMREWAGSHFSTLIQELGYDPKNPYQWVERALLPAEPDFELAQRFGIGGMGYEGYAGLVSGLQEIDAVGIARENAGGAKPSSTLFASLHLNNTLDTAMTHNALFGASDGDHKFAEMNVVLANYIMPLMQIGGVAVDRVLTASGPELRALPDKALNYIEPEDFEFINRVALPALNDMLRKGVAIHRAPSAARALPAVHERSGSEVLSVPVIAEGVAKTIRKKSPTAIGVPMWAQPGKTVSKVMTPRVLESEAQVHQFMYEMVEEVNVFSEQLVVYGLPKGIRLLDQK